MAKPTNQTVTTDNDLSFFRNVLEYTSKMSEFDNFEFRQGVMVLMKPYRYKIELLEWERRAGLSEPGTKNEITAKPNGHGNEEAMRLKREHPDDGAYIIYILILLSENSVEKHEDVGLGTALELGTSFFYLFNS